eukprot:626190-Amphidinium_carterae.1
MSEATAVQNLPRLCQHTVSAVTVMIQTGATFSCVSQCHLSSEVKISKPKQQRHGKRHTKQTRPTTIPLLLPAEEPSRALH